MSPPRHPLSDLNPGTKQNQAYQKRSDANRIGHQPEKAEHGKTKRMLSLVPKMQALGNLLTWNKRQPQGEQKHHPKRPTPEGRGLQIKVPHAVRSIVARNDRINNRTCRFGRDLHPCRHHSNCCVSNSHHRTGLYGKRTAHDKHPPADGFR